MIKSDQTDKIFAAFVTAQSQLGGVFKDSDNPHFRSRYASLENVIDAAKPVLTACELGFMQHIGARTEMGISVTTMLVHTSGQFIGDTQILPMIKADPQAAGSAITYARRYGLMSMLGLPATDDDAEEATRPVPAKDPKPAKTQTTIAPPKTDPAQFGAAATTAIEAAKMCTSKAQFDVWWNSTRPGVKAVLQEPEYAALYSAVIKIRKDLPETDQSEPKEAE